MSVPARRVPEVPEWLDGESARAGTAREAAERPPRSPDAPPPQFARKRKMHHLGFSVLATILVAPMLLGIVSMNALLAQTSFRIDEAERRVEELSTENLSLLHEQARLSAPGRIAAWASRNGMRLPDDIRSLHASGGAPAAPAGAADTSLPTEGGR